MRSGVLMPDLELPASGLVNVELAAAIAGVKPGTIRVWKTRGHLSTAKDVDGRELLDDRGRYLFDYLDVINAEHKLRAHAHRQVVPYLAAAEQSNRAA